MRNRHGYLAAAAIAWFLYINGDLYFRFDISGSTPDGGSSACTKLRDTLIKAGYRAECREFI